jgi:hypothetical protein
MVASLKAILVRARSVLQHRALPVFEFSRKVELRGSAMSMGF